MGTVKKGVLDGTRNWLAKLSITGNGPIKYPQILNALKLLRLIIPRENEGI